MLAPVADLTQLCGYCAERAARYFPPPKRPDVAEREQVVNADARAMLQAGTPEPVKSDFTEDEDKENES